MPYIPLRLRLARICTDSRWSNSSSQDCLQRRLEISNVREKTRELIFLVIAVVAIYYSGETSNEFRSLLQRKFRARRTIKNCRGTFLRCFWSDHDKRLPVLLFQIMAEQALHRSRRHLLCNLILTGKLGSSSYERREASRNFRCECCRRAASACTGEPFRKSRWLHNDHMNLLQASFLVKLKLSIKWHQGRWIPVHG